MKFELLHQHSKSSARVARLFTEHGVVETPVFMPVGTQATVKAVTPEMLDEAGAQIILANTYHLYLRPGAELIAQAGGLHRFMGWGKPILTDSGGYQIFSLSELREIKEEGASFRSHLDGSLHTLTPESVVNVQHLLGADIIMPLDQPAPYGCSESEAADAAWRTIRWAERSLREHHRIGDTCQALFGIVQGGYDISLRRANARGLVEMDFPGYAIGGLSLGEPWEITYQVLDEVNAILPQGKPRYLMGVGSPLHILEGVRRGVDMFDCVLPTRLARHGALLTDGGRMLIKNSEFARDWAPIDENCDCYTCRRFTRGYLRHLFKAGETLAFTLATIHNLRFMARFMENLRKAILDDLPFENLQLDQKGFMGGA